MAPSTGRCPSCLQPVGAGQQFCGACGAPLPASGPLPPLAGPMASPLPFAPVPVRRSPTQTVTGLLCMLLGFLLLWVPYVDLVGGILVFVGLIYLWVGRRELGPAHAREVVIGGALVVSAIVAATVAVTALVLATFRTALTLNGTQPSVSIPPLTTGELAVVVAALLAAIVLISLAYLALVYSLADRASRLLLWFAVALAIASGAADVAVEASALASLGAPSGFVALGGLSRESTLVGLLEVGPDVLFFAAYLRVRRRLLRGEGNLDATPSGSPGS
jgi:hypothetical protein